VAWRWYRRLEDFGYTTHAVVTNDEEAALFFEKEGMRYDRLLDHHCTITKNVTMVKLISNTLNEHKIIAVICLLHCPTTAV
jgi:hypothetical protein